MDGWEAIKAKHQRHRMTPPKTIIYKDETFYLQTSGKYYQSGRKTVKHRLLHRRIWSDAHGEIPDGHVIHHIDGNWQNNELTNLETIPSGKHSSAHMVERHKDPQMKALFDAGLAKAREAAKEWHSSDEGREWHVKNGLSVWETKTKGTAQCQKCNKTFETYWPSKAIYCSKACQSISAYYRDFTEIRKCTHCGQSFKANKYRKTSFCSRTCSNRARHSA